MVEKHIFTTFISNNKLNQAANTAEYYQLHIISDTHHTTTHLSSRLVFSLWSVVNISDIYLFYDWPLAMVTHFLKSQSSLISHIKNIFLAIACKGLSTNNIE